MWKYASATRRPVPRLLDETRTPQIVGRSRLLLRKYTPQYRALEHYTSRSRFGGAARGYQEGYELQFVPGVPPFSSIYISGWGLQQFTAL